MSMYREAMFPLRYVACFHHPDNDEQVEIDFPGGMYAEDLAAIVQEGFWLTESGEFAVDRASPHVLILPHRIIWIKMLRNVLPR